MSDQVSEWNLANHYSFVSSFVTSKRRQGKFKTLLTCIDTESIIYLFSVTCINHATDKYNVHYQEVGSLISSPSWNIKYYI